MSNPKNEPAFPVESCADHEFTGMSLRDYFAAKAMPGLMGRAWSPLEGVELINAWAKAAYEMADAMLAARSA